jgi:hypothetical protein
VPLGEILHADGELPGIEQSLLGVGLVGVARGPVVTVVQSDLGLGVVEVPAGRLVELGLEGEVFVLCVRHVTSRVGGSPERGPTDKAA